mgnify:CR=1 FL=1
MIIKTKNLVSISEANQNFSKIVKNVDENNSVIILKNNKPKYVLSAFTEQQFSESDMLELIARRILSEHKHAFEVLGQW